MSERRNAPKKEHLGDGVYAYFDGGHVWLEEHKEAGRPDSIAISQEIFNELLQFVGPIWYKEKMN